MVRREAISGKNAGSEKVWMGQIGMVGTKEVSESRGSFDGPPVDAGGRAGWPRRSGSGT